MASLYTDSAVNALNENDYINKLYDSTLESQKKTLQDGYDASVKQLDTGQQQTQAQTNDYVQRANVEGEKAAENYGASAGKLSSGSNAQAALTLGNQNQSNVTALNQQQAAADQEFERQRKLLADQYAAQITQAQADNDMERAQALYDAAKAEEQQLLSMRQSAASLMAGKGDYSITKAIAGGAGVSPNTKSKTWSSVLKNEDAVNKIYDAQMESQRQQAQMAYNEGASELEARQQEAQRQTDKNLTQTYVDALKNNKNYQEVQTAYGQGSGTAAQARLAREAGLSGDLTNLRTLQLGKDAQTEQDRAGLVRTLGDAISKAQKSTDSERAKALYDAAEGEEQALVQDQQTAGNLLAKKNDYSVLGKLYGLTQDQIDRLQGTGAYAPAASGSGTGSGKITLNKALEDYYGNEYDVGKNTYLTQQQVSDLYTRLGNAAKQDAAKQAEDALKAATLAGNKAAARTKK